MRDISALQNAVTSICRASRLPSGLPSVFSAALSIVAGGQGCNSPSARRKASSSAVVRAAIGGGNPAIVGRDVLARAGPGIKPGPSSP